MTLSKEQRQIIIDSILESILLENLNVTALSEKHNISRQSIYRYIKKLKDDGIVKQNKKTKKYELVNYTLSKVYKNENLQEHVIWTNDIKPFLKEIPKPAFNILEYTIGEILNNAIDHSDCEKINVVIQKNQYVIFVIIWDDGIGIFKKIQDSLSLSEKRFAILELSKGKFTTDPKKHTGEGIFFSSKASDKFLIFSDELMFAARNNDNDIIYEDEFTKQANPKGTIVLIGVLRNTTTKIDDIFNYYTEYPESYGFNKTTVPVKLLEYGDDSPVFVSRSQAKRLLAGFDKFNSITLDFEGVEAIRQGFADEIFRVFPQEHPQCTLNAINCNEQIDSMIKHVQNTK